MRFAFAGIVMLALATCGLAATADEVPIVVGVHHTMHATLIAPEGPGPHPGVVVLHTSGGLQDADLAYARALATQGYVCLVPEFMAAYGLDASSRKATFTDDAQPIYADLVSALGTLASDPRVHGAKLATIGFSNGGYFAVWLALTNQVQAGVGYYGAYSGAGTDVSVSRLSQAATATSAPVLILHGENDTTVPVGAARRLAHALEAAHAPYELHVYPQAGHLFDRGGFSPRAAFGKNPRLTGLAGHDTGDGAADTDAFTQTLRFLEANLH